MFDNLELTHDELHALSQNEKRKDKDLTEKIARMLKHRDEVMKSADLRTSILSVQQSLLLFTLRCADLQL